MTRREVAFAAIGVVLLFVGWLAGASQIPARDVVLEGSCRMPAHVIGPSEAGRPTAIVFHGLGANQKTVAALGKTLAAADMTVYLVDLPGHGNNATPFTFQRAESCAVEAVDTLERTGQIQLERTVLIGHSMGGALAIRLADYFPAAATVAISPAPLFQVSGLPPGALLTEPPRRMPVNLLITMAQYDFPFLQRSAGKLVEVAGGQRFRVPDDFLQRRAIRLVTIPGATHTSLIFDAKVWKLILTDWLQPILPVRTMQPLAARYFWGPVIGIVGLAFLVPLATRLLAVALHADMSSPEVRRVSAGRAILLWLAAGLLAVTILKFVLPMKFLRVYSGDYLASCLLLSGAMLSLALWRLRARSSRGTPLHHARAIVVGSVMGIATMLAFGAWMNWGLTDAWLNAARWLRFPPIALACLPYALAEEWALPAPLAGDLLAKVLRFLQFGAMRLLIWLSILIAVYLYSSGQVLLTVLVLYMGTFSALARFGADAIRRRTDSPAGAAVFTAILMAWFISSVFPLI